MLIRDTHCKERFEVDYCVTLHAGQCIESVAHDICIEQTVEIPEDCIPQTHFDDGLVGIVENIAQIDSRSCQYLVTISYRCDLCSYSVTQFLNTIFGNISLKDTIRIDSLRIPEILGSVFPGPTFGIHGIREKTGVYGRPLTCTALKPVGLSSESLAEMAYQFASGGADIIKDDHGITDQPYARFTDRVKMVHEAVMRSNEKTGHRTIYCPMLNDDPEMLLRQLDFCNSTGIEGILAAPMLIGCGMFTHIARQKRFLLMAHPALCGTFFCNNKHGATPAALLGTLFRLTGADISIFPNAGGRYHFTQQDCQGINDALRRPQSNLLPAFPAPAGGMRLERIPEMASMYGMDTVFIVGGNLQQQPVALSEATSAFVREVASCFSNSRTVA